MLHAQKRVYIFGSKINAYFTLSFYLVKSNNILLFFSKLTYFLLMAIHFATFSCHNAICRNDVLIFVTKGLYCKFLLSVSKTQFSM